MVSLLRGGEHKHGGELRATPMRIEPKTFFANERTFLSWLHMAITIGAPSAQAREGGSLLPGACR
jgi:hypothetical protein